MADTSTDVTDLAVEIILPDAPPDDLHAEVYESLGIVPDVKGPDRDLGDPNAIVVFLAGGIFEVLLDRFGNAALDRLARFCRKVLNSRKAPGVSREMRLVVGARRGVTFLVDGQVAEDARALAEMLNVDVASYPDGTTLRWRPGRARWEP